MIDVLCYDGTSKQQAQQGYIADWINSRSLVIGPWSFLLQIPNILIPDPCYPIPDSCYLLSGIGELPRALAGMCSEMKVFHGSR